MSATPHTLPKDERLSGKKTIALLMEGGRWGTAGCLRYRWMAGNGLPYNRIMVSVPKRSFKRAVKRNLLKRRIREAYRLQKELLPPGHDVLFIYTPREVLPFGEIFSDMTRALAAFP